MLLSGNPATSIFYSYWLLPKNMWKRRKIKVLNPLIAKGGKVDLFNIITIFIKICQQGMGVWLSYDMGNLMSR